MYIRVRNYLQDLTLAGLTPSTIHEYDTQLSHFARYCRDRGIDDADQLTAALLKGYLVDLRTHCKQSTTYSRSLVLKGFCRWLGMADGSVPHVSPPHSGDARRLRASEQEVRAFLSYLRGRFHADRTAMHLRSLVLALLLFGCGMRVGEVANLRLRDVDVDEGELHLSHTKTHTDRVVVLPGSVRATVRMYRHWREKQDVKTDKFLIGHRRSGVTAHTLARELRVLSGRLGMDLTSHTGRRYCITRLCYSTSVYVAMQVAGHSQLSTTQAYLSESHDEVKRAVRAHDPLS